MSESKSPFGLDVAWDRLTDARAQNDTSAEALTLSLVAQALYEEDRKDEAWEFKREVGKFVQEVDGAGSREILLSRFEVLTARGAEWEEAAGLGPIRRPARGEESYSDGRDKLLDFAREAYSTALSALIELGDAPEQLVEEARRRLAAVLPRREGDGGFPPLQISLGDAGTVLAGFLAVKALGPFLEEWAKKLGEHLGESTAQALGRIRLRRPSWNAGAGAELESAVPDAPAPTTLVLPGRLSDAARLAIIDLDPADDTVRGATLYWCERAGTWISQEELEADESLRGWVARCTWVVTEGGNRHPRHTYERAPTWQEAYDRAGQAFRDARAGVTLDLLHIRRAYEEDWGDAVYKSWGPPPS
ncbi:hypothetical protein [Streptomyces sp. NPDC054863]